MMEKTEDYPPPCPYYCLYCALNEWDRKERRQRDSTMNEEIVSLVQ